MAKKENCKLYRNFYEIIHPSISRKNISEYKIVFNEDIIPVQIFYPKKEIELNSIIIYIQGNKAYNNYYENLSLETNQIVILIDRKKDINTDDYFNAISYIINEAIKCNINTNNIFIMSDFEGTNILLDMKNKLDNKYSDIRKVLLSPLENNLVKFDFKNSLLLSNNEDVEIDNKNNIMIINESIYDFVNDEFSVTNEGLYLKIKNYIERKEV